MVIKFNPQCKITVYTENNTIEIKTPLTCQISITRGLHTTSTKASVEIYNLALSTRAEIQQNPFTYFDERKYLKIEAGYGSPSSLIFQGAILQAYSQKSGGQTDIITHIEAQALDIFDCQSSYTFEAGTSYQDILKTLGGDLKNCTIGNIGAIEGEIKTRTTFDGNTLDCINSLTGGASFIDNGTFNTILSNEVIDVPVPVIGDDTGLLETPVRKDAQLSVKMLFQADLIVGQLLEIKSRIAPEFNGQYKVLGFTHNLLFSGTQAGQRITTAELWIGALLPGADIQTTDGKIQNNFNKVRGLEVTPVQAVDPADYSDVFKYIKKYNGELPSTMITPSISWRNMLGNNNKPNERLAQLSESILANCVVTAKSLQAIIDKNYKGAKLQVNSGWRSIQNNTSCKGKPNSKHLKGLAIDFRLSGYNQSRIAKEIAGIFPGYVGYYTKGDFIHAQIDRVSKYVKPNDR